MPIVLTPTDVLSLTASTVTAADIEIAGAYIEEMTRRTLDSFVDSGRSESAVAAALAVVSVRVHAEMTATDGASALITSESQGDYSYSIDTARAAAGERDLMHGLPRKLLGLGSGRWQRAGMWSTDVLSDWWDDPRGFVQTRTFHDVV